MAGFSASSYEVGNAPQGASYAAPLVGMQLGQTIGNYPQDYFQGVQNQRTLNLQKPILGPDGQPTTDYTTIAQELLRRGGGEYAEKMLPFLYGVQADQGVTNVMMGMPPGQQQSRPAATSSSSGPSNVTPSQPQARPQDQPTVMKYVASQGIPNDQVGAISERISAQLGVGPNDPINPADPQVSNILNPAIAQFKKMGAGQVVQNGAPQGQPAPQTPQGAPQQAPGQQPPQSANGVPNPQEDDPTLGGLVPASWAAQGHTPSQYRDVLASVASRMGVSQNAKDAALARIKAIDDYMAKTSQTGYEAELKAQAPMNEAKAAGFKSVAEYQAATESAKEEAKGQASTLKDLADAGIEAKGQVGQLKVIRQLGDKVGYGAVPKIQALLGKYGIDTNGLTDIQAYERAIDYMAPQLRPIGSGRLMQQELNAFKAALGGLMTTPEGRRISVENLGLIAKYKAKVGAIASDSTLTPQQRIDRIYSVAPPELKTEVPAPKGGNGGGQQPTPAAQTQQAAGGDITKADYDNLPPGATFTSHGRQWQKPK